MIQTQLEAAATEFAFRLNTVVSAAVDTEVRFITRLKNGDHRAVIEASRSYGPSPAFPLRRQDEHRDVPSLLLDASYVVDLELGTGDLRVLTSTLGLWVDVTRGHKKHRPLVRLEYDRDPRTADRPAAHVHLHANSPEMAWVYGSSGRAAPDLHALHFPMGGQAFRPTLEDFLLFLNREKLYTDFKPGWKEGVLRSRRQWDEGQVASTVRKYPEISAGVLEGLGYMVSPPAGSPH